MTRTLPLSFLDPINGQDCFLSARITCSMLEELFIEIILLKHRFWTTPWTPWKRVQFRQQRCIYRIVRYINFFNIIFSGFLIQWNAQYFIDLDFKLSYPNIVATWWCNLLYFKLRPFTQWKFIVKNIKGLQYLVALQRFRIRNIEFKFLKIAMWNIW